MKPLVGTRLPTGIAALDELLGGGFHVPSIVLLTGQPGVGKTTFLHEVVNLWSHPSLLLGGMKLPGPVIRLVANVLPTETESVLVIDASGPLTPEDLHSLRSDKRLVIVVQHANKVPTQLSHDADVCLHMERRMERRVSIGTTLSCREKNRFSKKMGAIFRLTGSSYWRSE